MSTQEGRIAFLFASPGRSGQEIQVSRDRFIETDDFRSKNIFGVPEAPKFSQTERSYGPGRVLS